MVQKYTIRLTDEAAEKLLLLAGWNKDSTKTAQKALQDWLHALVSETPPRHGGLRDGAFGKENAKKKSKKGENSD